MKGKLVIFTAPSGAGKTTIVKHLLNNIEGLAFSVSATNRARRPKETDGKDYYFISTAEFEREIADGAFLEWEEVYAGQYYGTLKREVNRLLEEGKNIIFDIDVKGATNIKSAYPDNSLAIFVKPPSPEVLFERLLERRTEDNKSLAKRIARAAEELKYEKSFDVVLLNDNLEEAQKQAAILASNFLGI
jgi:guanylate kinase